MVDITGSPHASVCSKSVLTVHFLSYLRLSSSTEFSSGVGVGQGIEGHAALITSPVPSCHRCSQIRKGRLSHPTRPEPELWPGKSDLWGGHGRKGPWALLYLALLPCHCWVKLWRPVWIPPWISIHLSLPFSPMWIGSSATTPIGMSWTETSSLSHVL